MTKMALPTTIAVAHAHGGEDNMYNARSQAAKNKLKKNTAKKIKASYEPRPKDSSSKKTY